MKVLLVEDDLPLASVIVSFLGSEGFEVSHISRGLELASTIESWGPEIILLDLYLPDGDGLSLCGEIRPTFHRPIIIITAHDEELTEVTALNVGADSLLTKPIKPHLLLAHINAQLRRYQRIQDGSESTSIEVHDFCLQPQQRLLIKGGKPVELTDSEFDLLYLLMSRSGQVLSRNDLFSSIRRLEYDGIDRSLDMRISVLRRKIGDTKSPYQYIKTIRGRGYLFTTP